MLKLLAKLDDCFEKVIRFLLGVTMTVLTIMIILQVITRYVLRVNMGGLEELPVFLMIICVWLGAGVVAKNDDHVRIDLVQTMLKSERAKAILRIFVTGLTAAVMWFYTSLAVEFIQKSIAKNDISSGVGFPLWWPQLFVLIGSFAIALYYTKNTVKYVGGLLK